MLLWLVFALMSAGVVIMLLHPLLGRQSSAVQAADASAAVYQDQLSEIEAEAQRGLVGKDEAEAARREIARRLLAVHSADRPEPAVATSSGRRSPLSMMLAILTGVLIPVAAVAIYLQTGAPGLPAQPIAARRMAPPLEPEMAKLIAAVEQRLRDNPEDGRGWDVIAPVYLRIARYTEAANAFRKAAALLGDNPRRLAGLAEATMLAGNGRVSTDVRETLAKLLQLDPGHEQARFWLAFGLEQDGRPAEAAADYEKLLADAPADAPWRAMVSERLAAARAAQEVKPTSDGGGQGQIASAPPTTGLTAAEIAAAERMDPADRQKMVDGMVTGLAERLEKDGRDLAGWERLIRALTVLGRNEEAVAALGRARQSLADEPKALATLADLAKSLGLGT